MKRTFFYLLVLLFLPTTLVQAQTAVTLESLEVELWPDYDREAVLVLLTGTLPASTPLPATLSFPLPDGADFNVVARITPENVMTDQGMTPVVSDNQVTFVLTESRFRVEYYQPYSASDSQRAFSFTWQSDIAVEQFSITIQQPVAATNMTIVPIPISVGQGQDGLTYHVLPGQSVATGDSYSVEVGYTMSTPRLTQSFSNSGEELPLLEAVPVAESGFDWQLLIVVLGGLMLVGTAVWYAVSQQAASKRRSAKPSPMRTRQAAQKTAVSSSKPAGKVKFCHQCGQSLESKDKFCRSCGTAVKMK